VHHEEDFHVQAEHAEPQKECGQTVELDLGTGTVESVTLVSAKDDPRICRSPALRVEAPNG
jgi:hypothetical protein